MANTKAVERLVVEKDEVIEAPKLRKIKGFIIKVFANRIYNRKVDFYAHDGGTDTTLIAKNGEDVFATIAHIEILDKMKRHNLNTGEEITEYTYSVIRTVYEDE